MLKFYFLIFFLFLSCSDHSIETKEITVTNHVLNETPDYFVSFALDLAQIAGGKWWEGSSEFSMGRGGKNSKKLDFSREELIRLTKLLSPAIIRAGGSEADSISYGLNLSEDIPKGFQTNLSSTTWNNFYEFVIKTHNIPFFTLNIGPGYRDQNNRLTYKHFHKFFSFLKNSEHVVPYFELGNEINAFFLNYGLDGQIDSKQYASEYRSVKGILKDYFPSSKLLGPANAFWPFISEVFTKVSVSSKDIARELGDDLDILSWHFYPTQSHRCPININKANEYSMTHPTTVKSVDHILSEIKDIRTFGKFESWLGESGPAQCGGEPNVSDSFSSTLWWADFMGRVSKSKNKVMIRQTLVGSDYGLIDNNDLSLRHDYVTTFFFKKLKNRYSLKSLGMNEGVYVYCSEENKINVYAVNMESHQVRIVLKNLDDHDFKGFNVNEEASIDHMIAMGKKSFNFEEYEKQLYKSFHPHFILKPRSYTVLKSLKKSSLCLD